MRGSRITAARDFALVVALGIDYWATIAPAARRELQIWTRYARAAPNQNLRKLALDKLSSEALNSEAAAFFAILAPRANRRTLTRLHVAYQTAYDYLDAVNEQPGATPIHNGKQLHRALLPYALADTPEDDFYAYNPQVGDANYLEALVRTWRACLRTLPSATAIHDALAIATKRCAEAQAHNHAAANETYLALAGWARQQAHSSEYRWWELLAAGISCLAIHALLAAAGTPRTTARDASRINDAYFPDVCAISALLDSLIDYPDDMQTANHSFVAHYHSHTEAAARHAAIIRDAMTRLEGLDKPRRHNLILAGLVAYYLSAAGANRSPAVSSLDRAIPRDAITRTAMAIMRVRRRNHSRNNV